MIRIKVFFLIGMIVILFSCEIDNYDQPNGAIYGKLTDLITNEGLQTEQPNGFSIKLFEKGGSMSAPILFYGRPDGTYENKWIFRNEYKVIPSEGAFFSIDTVTVNVGSRTEVNFNVMPYLAVTNVSVNASAGQITANYEIVRDRVGDKISERKTLVSKVPTVSNTIYNYRFQQIDLAGTPDEEILATQYADVVTGIPSGTYYVRIAVRTNNPLRRYNYSKTYQVNVP